MNKEWIVKYRTKRVRFSSGVDLWDLAEIMVSATSAKVAVEEVLRSHSGFTIVSVFPEPKERSESPQGWKDADEE